ncbi:phospholipase C, phosphocholine-specific [Anopheles sinensis]|uniref:Phospholipase C, phosphocholine-specific n=1 Tax=Anopheles sinensis TaxID=74873 RepID=A0A084WTB7_ANOSI|nr:phospholipase C, phosphocholine-specific [Anopheles sinensis]
MAPAFRAISLQASAQRDEPLNWPRQSLTRPTLITLHRPSSNRLTRALEKRQLQFPPSPSALTHLGRDESGIPAFKCSKASSGGRTLSEYWLHTAVSWAAESDIIIRETAANPWWKVSHGMAIGAKVHTSSNSGTRCIRRSATGTGSAR